MNTANSQTPSRTLRLLSVAAPVINPVLTCTAYVAGGAGFAVALMDRDGVELLLSLALLGAAAALYLLTRRSEDE